jgi:segregation and condensation protein A
MIRYLDSVLKMARKNEAVSATKLFEEQRSRRAMICLFLAMLELVRMQAIALVQGELFGDIAIKKTREFETALAHDAPLAAIESDYN